jgi:hypothetical protein
MTPQPFEAPPPEFHACINCQGTGIATCWHCLGRGSRDGYYTSERCWFCKGQSIMTCAVCDGKGHMVMGVRSRCESDARNLIGEWFGEWEAQSGRLRGAAQVTVSQTDGAESISGTIRLHHHDVDHPSSQYGYIPFAGIFVNDTMAFRVRRGGDTLLVVKLTLRTERRLSGVGLGRQPVDLNLERQ